MVGANQAEEEAVRFLINQPTPEQIIAFHPSAGVAARFYDLVDAEREHALSSEEQHEMETFLYIEHMMRLLKAAAHQVLQEKAS